MKSENDDASSMKFLKLRKVLYSKFYIFILHFIFKMNLTNQLKKKIKFICEIYAHIMNVVGKM